MFHICMCQFHGYTYIPRVPTLCLSVCVLYSKGSDYVLEMNNEAIQMPTLFLKQERLYYYQLKQTSE